MGVKTLIIGLDGATFSLLQPFMDQGCLPTLKALMEDGCSGELRSTIPPITGPAWSSFMTGLNPGEHGIYDFLVRDEKTGKDIPVNAHLRRGKAFWDYLSDAGKKVIVLNVPVTYPPTPVNGVMISGFLTPSGKRDFIYPLNLVDEIENKFGKYPLYFRMPIASPGLSDANTISFLKELNYIREYKFKVAHYLFDKFDSDLLMLHIWGTDRIQHELWNFFDETHSQFNERKKEKFYDEILQYYKNLDREISELIHAG
jgi:predicted AlkP superfamily phosphohydrolase/phosphomutase